jgi:hypothetical protein
MKKTMLSVCIISAFLLSCDFGLLDNQGVEEVVSEKRELLSNEPIDDSPDGKTLVYDKDRTVTEYFENCAVTLNKSKTLTRLDIMDMKKSDPDLVEEIFPNRSAAMKAINGRLDKDVSFFPSIETVNGKLKKFNDGLYAGVELALENGISDFPSKPDFLNKVSVKLNDLEKDVSKTGIAHINSAKVYIAVALKLSNVADIPFSSEILKEADSVINEMDKDFFLQPMGFYTWSDELKMIFKRDRYLQNYHDDIDPYTEETVGKAVALALAITADPDLETEYDQILGVYSDLTNPFADIPVTALKSYIIGIESLDEVSSIAKSFLADNPPEYIEPSCNNHFALIPASYSKETDYFQSITCRPDYAGGINFMDELIAAIKNGKINLEPDDDSGWYDYQSYALETLLLPERGEENNNLLLTKAYKEKLIESFKSIMIQNRETHAKSLEMGSSDRMAIEPKPFDIYPKLPVEPFATFYLRNARAYRFLNTALTAITGVDFMDEVKVHYEKGESDFSLSDGLRYMTRLMYGLSFIAADSVGAKMTLLEDELSKSEIEACRTDAHNWLAEWTEDSDIKTDPRVAVPVQYDYYENTVTYWAVIGVRIIRATTEFHKDFLPEIVKIGGDGEESWDCKFREFLPHDYYMMIEKSAEFTVDMDKPVLDRETFRALCNKGTTEKEILEELANY